MSDQKIRWEDLPQEVQDAVERGSKIEAIKLLREARGPKVLGLKEAKDAIDPIFAEHAPEGARSGCGGAVLAAVTLGGALAALGAGAAHHLLA